MLGERCDIEALGVLDRAIVFHDADDLEAFRAHDLGGHSADFAETLDDDAASLELSVKGRGTCFRATGNRGGRSSGCCRH